MRCVLFALMVVCCLSEMCRAITLSEMDSYEKKSIDKLISHNSKLVYDDELMRLAETEAKRLAGIGSLAPPQITLSKNYFGYSFQTNEMSKYIFIYLFLEDLHSKYEIIADVNNREKADQGQPAHVLQQLPQGLGG